MGFLLESHMSVNTCFVNYYPCPHIQNVEVNDHPVSIGVTCDCKPILQNKIILKTHLGVWSQVLVGGGDINGGNWKTNNILR